MSSSKKIETEEIRAIPADRSGGHKGPTGGHFDALDAFFARQLKQPVDTTAGPKPCGVAGRGYLPCGVL
jgi:hypothetical protein